MNHEVTENRLGGIEAHPGNGHYAVFDHGAHAWAWQPDGQRQVLWMSTQSAFANGQPIRGGIPVIFPWFGAGSQGTLSPLHGFVRLTDWNRYYVDDTIDINGRLVVEYQIDRTRVGTQSEFPFAFMAQLRLIFTHEYLQIGLKINNADVVPFTFEEAFHTYLAVGDARHVTLDGLEAAPYLDRSVGAPTRDAVQSGLVRIEGETDRLYSHHGSVTLDDPTWSRTLLVSKEGSANTVVWNPWAAKAAAMPDFGDDEWTQMICIEAANVGANAITLAPGETHLMRQRISLVGTAPTR